MTPDDAPVRGSTAAFLLIGALTALVASAVAHGLWRGGDAARMAQNRAMAEALDLTDIALFPEARYTRHPNMADLHSAFQDGPLSFEHFPAGTLIAPARDFANGGLSDRERDAP